MRKLFNNLIKNKKFYLKPTITALPILQLEKKEKNDKTKYFEEIGADGYTGLKSKYSDWLLKKKEESATVDVIFDVEYSNGVSKVEDLNLVLKLQRKLIKDNKLEEDEDYFDADEIVVFDMTSSFIGKGENLFRQQTQYLESVKNLISGDFTGQEFWWVTVFDTEGYLDPTIISLVYLNILAFLLFTFLFIEYPLVPVLFVIELVMFIPVLLLYLFASESVFVFLIYIINAVTVEAVSAVGIAMSYLMGWKFRDITSRDVLEAKVFNHLLLYNLSVICFKKEFVKNSWYLINKAGTGHVFKKLLRLSLPIKLIYLIKFKLLLLLVFVASLDNEFFSFFEISSKIFETFNYVLFFQKYLTVFYWDNSTELFNHKQNFKGIYTKSNRSKHFELISDYFVLKNVTYVNFSKNLNLYFNTREGGMGLSLENLHKSELEAKLRRKWVIGSNLRRVMGTLAEMSLKENPTNVLINLGILESSLISVPDFRNFDSKPSKNNVNFYQTNDNLNIVKNRKKTKINKLNMFYYELYQLELAGTSISAVGSKYNFLKNYNLIKNYLKNNINIPYKSKNQKITDTDFNLISYNLKKINLLTENLKFNKRNLTQFMNSNLKYLKFFDENSKYGANPTNCYKVKYLKNKSNTDWFSYLKEYNFLNFEKTKTTDFLNFVNFYLNTNFKNSTNFYKQQRLGLSTALIVDKSYNYKANYKFYFKKNKKYLKMFSSNFAYYGWVFLDNKNTQINLKNKLFKKSNNLLKYFITNWFLNQRKTIKNVEFEKMNSLVKKKSFYREAVKYSKLKIKHNWADKNFEVINQPNSKVLPWFENNDYESEVFDLSSTGLFNDTLFLSEILKSNLKSKLKYSKYILGLELENSDNKLIMYNFYLNKTKKNNTTVNLENTKALVSELSLNWDFEDTFEVYKQKIYLNTLSKFYEHNIYIKRLKKINMEFPSNSQRSLSLLADDQFNLINDSLFSTQSKEFGIVSTDFVENSKSNKTKDSKKVYDSWITRGKNKTLFSFSNTNASRSTLKNFKLIGTNFSTRNNNFNLYSNFTKSLNMTFGINKEFGAITANTKKDFERYSKSNVDNYSANLNDVLKNPTKDMFDNKTKYSEDMEKLKIFWLPKKKIDDAGVNFWNKNEISVFNNKKITTDRFLSTFKKKIKIRENFLALSLGRLDSRAVNANPLIKIVQNVGKSNFDKQIRSNSSDYISDNYNKISLMGVKNFDKITLVEDSEVFDSNVRFNIDKPHTFYGYLWDEYLKQTYGVNLNFVNFNNKTLDLSLPKNKNFNLDSNNFQNNFENNLKPENLYVGLTKDREIANTITSKLLPKLGFVREIFEVEKFRNWRREEGSLGFDENFPFIEGFWNTQKKEIFSDIIFKKKLIKKSIENIKKYSESPPGFKKTNTPIDIKLPYLKRKFWIKNEDSYNSYLKSPKNYNWLGYKNKKNNFINRLELTTQLSENDYWGSFETSKRINWQEYIYRSEMLNNSIDFEFGSKTERDDHLLNTLQETNIYFDKDSDGYLTNSKLSKIKRASKRHESLDKEINIIVNESEFRSAFSNTNENGLRKKKRNFRLFKKLEMYGNSVLGNSSISKYRNNLGFEKNVIMVDIQNIRRNQKFGDFYTYKNPVIEQIRSSNFKLKKLNEVFLKKLYKRQLLIKSSFSKDHRNSEFLNLALDKFPSKNLLENSINPRQAGKLDVSRNYKLKNYMSKQYFGFLGDNFQLFDNLKPENILKNQNKFKKNIFSFDNHKELLRNNFATEVSKYSIKYNYMGLSNKLTDNFSTYENFFNSNTIPNSDNLLNKNLIFYKQKNYNMGVKFKKAELEFPYYHNNIKYSSIYRFFVNEYNFVKIYLGWFKIYCGVNSKNYLLIWKIFNIKNLAYIANLKSNVGLVEKNHLFTKNRLWFYLFETNLVKKKNTNLLTIILHIFFSKFY